MQSNLATERSNSRREQKKRESYYSHHSCRQRKESEGNFTVVMYSINHCMSVKTSLCQIQKASQWKNFACTMHFLLHQPKNSHTQRRRLHIFNSFPSQFFFQIWISFFFFLQSCQDFVQDFWHKPMNIWLDESNPCSAYSPPLSWTEEIVLMEYVKK